MFCLNNKSVGLENITHLFHILLFNKSHNHSDFHLRLMKNFNFHIFPPFFKVDVAKLLSTLKAISCPDIQHATLKDTFSRPNFILHIIFHPETHH